MSGEISFEKAELLFDIGEYEKSFDMITALVEQPDVQEPYKLWTLAAKSYLYLIKALSDEDNYSFPSWPLPYGNRSRDAPSGRPSMPSLERSRECRTG